MATGAESHPFGLAMATPVHDPRFVPDQVVDSKNIKLSKKLDALTIFTFSKID